MMKTRKNSGLRRAHTMYQGRAAAEKAAMPRGCRSRSASCRRLVTHAQNNTAPAQRTMAAGPLARTASAREKPNRINASHGVRGRMGVFSLRVSPRTTAVETIVMVGMTMKGIAVDADL